MIQNAYGSKRGFTIVELLIVVVVIAILAAITIVAYNGIQVKAWNSKAVSNVDIYRKALMAYAVENNGYPSYAAYSVCLGGGYPDKNSDGIGDCVVNADGSVTASQVTGSSDPLNTVLGKQPTIGDGPYLQRPLAAPHNQYFVISSVRYIYDTSMRFNGQVNPSWLVHIIRGKGIDCRQPLADSIAGGITNFTSASESAMKSDEWKECYEPLPVVQ